MNSIPDEFHRLIAMDDVISKFSSIYVREPHDGQLTLGFHVDPWHCNQQGNCHGGTWATVADVLMGLSVNLATGMAGPTVSMSLDFLGAVTAGQWVEGRGRVLRSTPKLGFADCLFTADDEPVLRASAVFRRKITNYAEFNALVTFAK